MSRASSDTLHTKGDAPLDSPISFFEMTTKNRLRTAPTALGIYISDSRNIYLLILIKTQKGFVHHIHKGCYSHRNDERLVTTVEDSSVKLLMAMKY